MSEDRFRGEKLIMRQKKWKGVANVLEGEGSFCGQKQE